MSRNASRVEARQHLGLDLEEAAPGGLDASRRRRWSSSRHSVPGWWWSIGSSSVNGEVSVMRRPTLFGEATCEELRAAGRQAGVVELRGDDAGERVLARRSPRDRRGCRRARVAVASTASAAPSPAASRRESSATQVVHGVGEGVRQVLGHGRRRRRRPRGTIRRELVLDRGRRRPRRRRWRRRSKSSSLGRSSADDEHEQGAAPTASDARRRRRSRGAPTAAELAVAAPARPPVAARAAPTKSAAADRQRPGPRAGDLGDRRGARPRRR